MGMIPKQYYRWFNGEYQLIDWVVDGAPVSETVEETLDTATIIVHNNTRDFFKVWQPIKIVVEGEPFYYVIADYQQDRRKTKVRVFKHTITLIEPVKYLEKVICQRMSYTNRSNTLVEQLERLLINAEPIEVGQTPRFKLANGLKNFLTALGTMGEDFFFNEPPTLREALDTMLAVVDCRCYIKELTDFNDITIDYYDINKKGNLINIDLNSALKEQTVHNIEYLASDLESYADNSFSGNRQPIWHPGLSGWETPKSDSAALTTGNAVFRTSFPIEKITDFHVHVKYKIRVKTQSGTIENPEFDYSGTIVSNVVDKETYDVLEEAGSKEKTMTDKLYKENTIYYVRQSSQGTLADSHTIKLFYSISNIETAIANSLWNGIVASWAEWNNATVSLISLENFSITTLKHRIQYIPFIDAHVKMSKPNYNEVPSTMIDNQSDKTIDLGRYGDNLKGKIKRLGNKEIYIDKIHHSMSEVWSLQDYTSDGYIITQRDLAFTNWHIKAHYRFTKDFNNLNTKIGIDRRKRVYNIPLENMVRDILIKEYMLASFTEMAPTGSYAGNVTKFLQAFNASEKNLPVSIAIVRTGLGTQPVKGWVSTDPGEVTIHASSGINTPNSSYLPEAKRYPIGTVGLVYNDEFSQMLYFVVSAIGSETNEYSTNYELPVVAYSMGNSLLFKFRFLDNAIAGIAPGDKVFGKQLLRQYPYTNNDGEYYEIRIRLYNDDPDYADRNEALLPLLPSTNANWYANCENPFDGTFKIIKDAYEHHQFTIQLEVLSNDPDIIIGTALVDTNGLVSFKKSYFKVWKHNEKYASYETKLKKGSTEITNGHLYVVGDNSDGLFADIEDQMTSVDQSWAVTDENNRLVLAVNRKGATMNYIVYFTPRKSRV